MSGSTQEHVAVKRSLVYRIANYRFDSTLLYYVALALYFVKGFPSATTLKGAGWIDPMVRVVTYTVLILLVLKLLFQTYTHRDILVIEIFGAVTLISYLRCGLQTLVFLYLFIIASKDIDIKTVAKEFFWVTVLCVSAIMLLTQLGVLASTTQYVTSESRSYFWSSGNTIYLWAFRHHNFLGRYCLIICMSYVIMRYEEFRGRDYLFLAAMFWFCYFPIKSRTPAFIILLIIALVFLFKVLNSFEDRVQNGVARLVVYGLMLFSVVFSVYVCVNYDSTSSFYAVLDDLLTGRVSYANYFYDRFGFSILGQYVEIINTDTATKLGVNATIFDNAYMHVFVRFGFAFGLALFGGYLLSAKAALDNRDYGIALLIAAFAVCGISETWFYDISSNPYPILAALAFYKQLGQPSASPLFATSKTNRVGRKRKQALTGSTPSFQRG